LLQLAHQESSAHTMSREPCDLATLARDAASHLAPLAHERQLAIETELHRAPCVGDPAALNTLITNLIANALQHHHRAGGVIRVTSSLEHDHVVLAVRDDGPGIPAADLPHLFERFYRVDKARTGSSGHSGLGLAIAHTIVENHQGSLTAANNPDGRGATFTVRLPLTTKTSAVA
jgi:signal transduction histidine kinase